MLFIAWLCFTRFNEFCKRLATCSVKRVRKTYLASMNSKSSNSETFVTNQDVLFLIARFCAFPDLLSFIKDWQLVLATCSVQTVIRAFQEIKRSQQKLKPWKSLHLKTKTLCISLHNSAFPDFMSSWKDWQLVASKDLNVIKI